MRSTDVRGSRMAIAGTRGSRGSSRSSAPRSDKRIAAVAVTILVIENHGHVIAGAAATPVVRFADPAAALPRSPSGPTTAIAIPGTRSEARARSFVSRIEPATSSSPRSRSVSRCSGGRHRRHCHTRPVPMDEIPSGFRLLGVSVEDAPAIVDVVNECTVAEIGFPYTTLEETRDDLTSPGRDGGAADALLLEEGGSPAGYLQVLADVTPAHGDPGDRVRSPALLGPRAERVAPAARRGSRALDAGPRPRPASRGVPRRPVRRERRRGPALRRARLRARPRRSG